MSQSVAPIIGLHAHGWDDEPPVQVPNHPLGSLWSERGDDWSGQSGTWGIPIHSRTNGWESDVPTHNNGWETDIPTDWGSVSNPIWTDSSKEQMTVGGFFGVWPRSNDAVPPQSRRANLHVWEEPAVSAKTPAHNEGRWFPQDLDINNDYSWQRKESDLVSHNMFLENLNKMLTQNLSTAREHENLAKDLEDHLVRKIQQNEILEDKIINLQFQIMKLQDQLEEQKKHSYIENLIKRLLSDLDEAKLKIQELLLSKIREEQRESRLCVVCIDHDRTNLVTPCGHFCLCESCVNQLPRPIKCPVCRGDAREIIKVYT